MKRIILSLLLMVICTMQASAQSKDLFRVLEHDRFGYMDSSGNIVVPLIYRNALDFSEGLAAVRMEGRYGYINSSGKYAIPLLYDYANNFNGGVAIVYLDGKPLMINKMGQVVLDTYFSFLSQISATKIIVSGASGNKGIWDLGQKKLIADTVYNEIDKFNEGFAPVYRKKKNKEGYGHPESFAFIDTNGRQIVPFGRYIAVDNFSDGYARVRIKYTSKKITKYREGVIDTKGNLLFQRRESSHTYLSGDFGDGLAPIILCNCSFHDNEDEHPSSDSTYYGYIDSEGTVVYEDTLHRTLYDFRCGRALARVNNKPFYIIDRQFHIIGKDSFDKVEDESFLNGIAIVANKNQWGIVDTNGNYIVPPKYGSIRGLDIENRIFFYETEAEDGLWGMANLMGETICNPIMQAIDNLGYQNGLLRAVVNKRLTYFDLRGNIVWQEKFVEKQTLDTMNIDAMNRGYFYAYAAPIPEETKGFAISENRPVKISDTTFPADALSVVVNTSRQDTIYGKYRAFTVYVANQCGDMQTFNAQDSRLYMKVQAKNKSGQWKDIEYLPSSWCGNSYHTLTLESGYYWTFQTPMYQGCFKTKLRIALQYIDSNHKSKKYGKKERTIYSNEYDGSVNPGQFWNKRKYVSGGIMDPYDD